MNSKFVIRLSLWLLSISVAFTAGWLFSTRPNESIRGKGAHETTRSQSHQPREVPSNLPKEFRFIPTDAGKTSTLSSIITHQDPVSRTAATLALIKTLDANDYPSVIKHFEATAMTTARNVEYGLLLTAWAQVAPRDAITYTVENNSGIFAEKTILTNWAISDPEAAVNWAQAYNTEKGLGEENPWITGVICGAVSHDLDLASSLLQSLPQSTSRDEAVRSIVDHLFTSDPARLESWIATLPESEIRSEAIAIMASNLARTNPSASAQILLDAKDPEAFIKAGAELSEALYNEDPEAAKLWAQNLPVYALGEAAKGITKAATVEDPIKAAQWLVDLIEASPEGNYDAAIEELVNYSISPDPEVAAEWINSLPKGDQGALYHKVLSDWITVDETGARSWMEFRADELPESIKKRFFK